MRKQNKDELLVIVDCGEMDADSYNAALDEVRQKAADIEIKETVEYIPAASDIGRTAINDSQPFFERIIVDVSVPPENFD